MRRRGAGSLKWRDIINERALGLHSGPAFAVAGEAHKRVALMAGRGEHSPVGSSHSVRLEDAEATSSRCCPYVGNIMGPHIMLRLALSPHRGRGVGRPRLALKRRFNVNSTRIKVVAPPPRAVRPVIKSPLRCCALCGSYLSLRRSSRRAASTRRAVRVLSLVCSLLFVSCNAALKAPAPGRGGFKAQGGPMAAVPSNAYATPKQGVAMAKTASAGRPQDNASDVPTSPSPAYRTRPAQASMQATMAPMANETHFPSPTWFVTPVGKSSSALEQMGRLTLVGAALCHLARWRFQGSRPPSL